MATATATPASTTTWKLDPAHSAAEFKVKHMMISNVKGSFSNLSGLLIEDPVDPRQSSIEASIDVSTLSTGDAQRDGHLKSTDFFDVEKFPTMTFKSTLVKKIGQHEHAVTGDLTLHGVIRPVTFAVEGPSAPGKDPWGNTRIGLLATTKINRKDFGLAWNAALETGGVLVGEDVSITLDVQSEPELLLEADEDRLGQIIMNLMQNGINYTPEGGKVKVRAEFVAGKDEEESDIVGASPKKRVQQARQRFAQASRHYFFHTLVGRASNEALSRVVALRLSRMRGGNAVATPDDYGFVLTVTPEQHFTSEELPSLLNAQDFAGCAAAIAVIQPILFNWRFGQLREIQW